MSEEANPQAAVVPSPAAEPVPVSDAMAHPEVRADANGAVPNGAPEVATEPKEVAIPTTNDAPAPTECKSLDQTFAFYSSTDSILSAFSYKTRRDKRQTNRA
jgi:hypothetical protein